MQFGRIADVKNNFTQALACVLVIGLALSIVAVPKSATALTITPRLELNGDPGIAINATLKVINEERESRTFFLRFENFNAQDESGNPQFTTRREGLSTWIKAPASITIGPGETFELPVRIDIPATAEPGGHFAAIFLTRESPEQEPDLGRVAVNARLGSLVLLRVNGDFEQDATLLQFNTTDQKKFFTQLPVQFYFRFQNIGDDHLKPLGDVQIKNTFGQTVKLLSANTVDGSVLPKSVRRFTTVWSEAGGQLKQESVVDLPDAEARTFWQSVGYQAKHFTFGRYTARLKIVYGTKELKSTNAEVIFYIIPWQLLAVAIPSVIILLILLRSGIKRYNRYIIARAQTKRKK